jgi:hypothetical protein
MSIIRVSQGIVMTGGVWLIQTPCRITIMTIMNAHPTLVKLVVTAAPLVLLAPAEQVVKVGRLGLGVTVAAIMMQEELMTAAVRALVVLAAVAVIAVPVGAILDRMLGASAEPADRRAVLVLRVVLAATTVVLAAVAVLLSGT